MAANQTETTQGQPQNILRWVRIAFVGRNPKRTMVRIAILVVLSFVITKFVFLPIRVDGISMYPTYKDGQIDFINRLIYLGREPHRGDVVGIRVGGTNYLFRTPGVMYLKRIVGMPGETVRFSHGKLLIDGEEMEEPYETLKCNWNSVPVKCGANQYFLVGDNRSMPEEYHYHGRIGREQIVGKVLY